MRDYTNDIWIEFYLDEQNEWRWRIWHRNGRIAADSGEGYQDVRDCLSDLETIHNALVVGFDSQHGSEVEIRGLPADLILPSLGGRITTPDEGTADLASSLSIGQMDSGPLLWIFVGGAPVRPLTAQEMQAAQGLFAQSG